jgi:acetyl-CoA carboxylase, biotin carboxylase subunit
LPSTGTIAHYNQPSGPGVRVDSGCSTGSEISIYYDPMIAKLITFSKNRSEAINKMKRALSEYYVSGMTTNIDFLKIIMAHSDFGSGNYDINFIDREIENILTNNSSLSDVNEDAASILSAIIKYQRISNGFKEKKISENKWGELKYE